MVFILPVELGKVSGISVRVGTVISHEVNNNQHFIIVRKGFQLLNECAIIEVRFRCFSDVMIDPDLLICFRSNDRYRGVIVTIAYLVTKLNRFITGSFGHFNDRNCIF